MSGDLIPHVVAAENDALVAKSATSVLFRWRRGRNVHHVRVLDGVRHLSGGSDTRVVVLVFREAVV